ncbi:serine/threonine protein kinase [Saccharopolyspora gregorii]|uniref:non-specific serine/threonine protein kinase n=1 Tax=Saccharopolyspora gregorii TaxID=33914 RepID=A0ABP6RYM7_9PSEU|nr:serine/threonine-protein kinase [Saccharopolyspora gregorii]
MSEDLTGRRLGHYKIDGVLGRGGMSVMYRATDTRLGRKVALKIMGEHITGDAEFRERFVDEARNTSAIDHANIVPLYDFGEVDGMLYIAMRLVDGSDLASLIKDGPISPPRALELLSQVAEALDMLHERGLVHLDLKPANVLVTSRESSNEHVYLADFGLTRRGATGHRTSSGDFLGSPTYAAPEHLRGEPVDGRTDLYALCCMLFACLTGRPPFQGQVQEVIQGHLGTAPPSALSLVALPVGLDEVLRKGMSKKADQRYDTCKELMAAAKAALNAPPDAPTKKTMPTLGPPSGPQQVQPAPPQARSPQQSGPVPPPAAPVTGPQPAPSGPQPAPGPQQSGPYGPPYQQPPRPMSGPGADPVRLRPPMPVQSASFATDKGGGSAKWLVPLLIALAAIVLVIVFIALASSSSGGSGGSGGATTSAANSSSVEPSGLPTEVPTVGR